MSLQLHSLSNLSCRIQANSSELSCVQMHSKQVKQSAASCCSCFAMQMQFLALLRLR